MAVIFRSIDRRRTGNCWYELQTGAHATFVGVSPVTPDLVFAVTNQGLFKSTDGGDNWSSVRNTSGKIVFDPVSSSTLYYLAFQAKACSRARTTGKRGPR